MENPAQEQDLTNRGYTGPADPAVQKEWLDVAFRALRRELRLNGVDIDADPAPVDPSDIKDVVVSAALRVLRNPEGAKSTSGSVDDYSESTDHADATEDVYFTAAELRGLIPLGSIDTGWAGSVKYS